MDLLDTPPSPEPRLADQHALAALAFPSLEAKLVHRAFRPLFANAAAATMFCYESEIALLGQASIIGLFDIETRADPETAWRRALAAPRAVFNRRTLMRSNGAAFAAETLTQRVRWRDGPAVVIAIVDVSESERAGRALARLKAQTADTAHEHADLMVSARALQTPLRAIRAQLAPLARAGAPHVSQALSACDQALNAAARLNGRTHDETPALFDVNALIAETIEAARAAMPGLIITRADSPTRYATGMAGRMRRAMLRLLHVAAAQAQGGPFAARNHLDDFALTLRAEIGETASPPDAAGLQMARALFESLGGVVAAR
ncbi:MAG: hypothetical protein AB7L65_09270, partial [Hyphomonadaceae bacterium]